jgi:hypothetical protein
MTKYLYFPIECIVKEKDYEVNKCQKSKKIFEFEHSVSAIFFF